MAKTTKVWHVTDYDVLYKAIAPNRKDELNQVQYTQRHINPPHDKPEAVQCVNRFRALQQTRPIEQYLKIKYVYEELLDQSQGHSGKFKYLRGYVVDECMQAPSTRRICQMLPLLKAADVQTALKELARVKLIEQVGLPAGPPPDEERGQAEQTGEPPAENGLFDGEKPECTSGAPQVHLPSQEAGKGNKNTRRPSASGNEERKRNRPSASKGKGESSAAGAADDPNPKGEANAKAPADAGPGGEHGAKNPKPEGQAGQERQGPQKPVREAESDSGNADLGPGDPTKADGLGEGKPLSNVELDLVFDQTGEAFAQTIYRTIGTPYPWESEQGRSELASFASVWQKTVELLRTPMRLQKAWDIGVKQAAQLRKARLCGDKRFRKSAEAVWSFKFQKAVGKLKAAG